MRRIFRAALVVGLVLSAGAVVTPRPSPGTSGKTAALPPAQPVVSDQLACDALLTTTIWEDPGQKGQITTQNERATDKLAIKIKDKAVTFMTRASVEAGIAEPAEFTIVSNKKDFLMAIYFEEGALPPSLNSLVLNKESGFAVWAKSRPHFLLGSTPYVESIYLACK